MTTALRNYASELAEIIGAYQAQAQFVGASVESSVPKDLSTEQEVTEESIRIVQAFGEGATRRFGQRIDVIHLQTMAAAITLWRDGVEARLSTIEADPLMPAGAETPLRLAIEEVDREYEKVWGQHGPSTWLGRLRERREMKKGLAYPLEADLDVLIQDGEGQKLEFIEAFPEQAHDLAKELAAFGTSNPGIILLGVADDGTVIGLSNVQGTKAQDRLRTRVEGVSSNGIIPSLLVRVRFTRLKRRLIAVVEVPKGPEPVYYTKNGVPYIRHGSMSRPALPQEVNELVRRHLESRH